MTQTSIRLPRALHDQLVQVAGERGISTEIRSRLEASLSNEAPAVGDPKTQEVLSNIARAIRILDDGFGPWHKSRFATAVLVHLASRIVALARPDYQPSLKLDPEFDEIRKGSFIDRMTSRMLPGEETAEQMAGVLGLFLELGMME